MRPAIKILAVLLVAVLLFGLTACGNGSENSAVTTANVAQIVRTVAAITDQAALAAIARFQAQRLLDPAQWTMDVGGGMYGWKPELYDDDYIIASFRAYNHGDITGWSLDIIVVTDGLLEVEPAASPDSFGVQLRWQNYWEAGMRNGQLWRLGKQEFEKAANELVAFGIVVNNNETGGVHRIQTPNAIPGAPNPEGYRPFAFAVETFAFLGEANQGSFRPW